MCLTVRKKDGVNEQFADVDDEGENGRWHLPVEKPLGCPQGQGHEGDEEGNGRCHLQSLQKLTPVPFHVNDYKV